MEIDGLDRDIITELTRNARISVAALAQKVHVSRAHCYSRLNRLREEGIITGFTVTIHPEKVGLGASAHVTLKLRQHNWRELKARLLSIPEVWHVSLVGGNVDVMLLVRARDNADLRRVIFDEIQTLPGVVDSQTFMIFEDHESRHPLPTLARR